MANEIVSARLISERPDIYGYHDYREFLTDLISYSRNQDENFSMRELARQAQVSVSHLSMVLAGDRNLSKKSLSKILPLLHLNSAEQSYLDLIRIISDSDSQKKRLVAMAR